MLAPAGTGIEIRRKLSDEMRQILNQGEVQEKLKDLGVENRGMTPEEFDTFRRSSIPT